MRAAKVPAHSGDVVRNRSVVALDLTGDIANAPASGVVVHLTDLGDNMLAVEAIAVPAHKPVADTITAITDTVTTEVTVGPGAATTTMDMAMIRTRKTTAIALRVAPVPSTRLLDC